MPKEWHTFFHHRDPSVRALRSASLKRCLPGRFMSRLGKYEARLQIIAFVDGDYYLAMDEGV